MDRPGGGPAAGGTNQLSAFGGKGEQEVITAEAVEKRLRLRRVPARWQGRPPTAFRFLTADSRCARPGDLFCAVAGLKADGHTFLEDARRAGAAAAVVQHGSEVDLPQLVVPDTQTALSHLAMLWEGDPAAGMRLIGITGTNGKTTTAWVIRHLLTGLGRAASLGTLGIVDPAGHRHPGELTTPDPLDLAASLGILRDRGVEFAALEVSSHALDQHRVDGLQFDYGVFTSFSREHLDYHQEMAAYLKAKLRLTELLAPGGVIVLNGDEPAWDPLRTAAPEVVTTGLGGDAQVRADLVETGPAGTRFRLAGAFGEAAVELPLIGRFNVQNALAAAAVAFRLGMSAREVAERLAVVPQVPGRFEILSREPCVVLRDYAHTPDAFELVLEALRAIVPGRILMVFGCGGDRDAGKRPLMGQVAGSRADHVVITSDNPRSEDAAQIAKEAVARMDPARYEIILDRRDAIARALELAAPDDAVLLAGKGHETYQIIGARKFPFDEAQVVAELRGEAA
jgi:UDP-N-acetylmuramoyl-L-alanyl-D-glutamate--2,6-diaminopimelate ligase